MFIINRDTFYWIHFYKQPPTFFSYVCKIAKSFPFFIDYVSDEVIPAYYKTE